MDLALSTLPTPLGVLGQLRFFVPHEKAGERVFEFFTATINNKNTRLAYLNACRRFSAWCEAQQLELAHVRPFHVAAFIKQVETQFTAPTAKLHLAALRGLFDYLVTGQVIEMNPAHAVRGPRYVITTGKTPVLDAEEARALLESMNRGTILDLRDRALIGTMVYTFARIGAVVKMTREDYFIQGRRGWVRLHEKGGKEHQVPCHHLLEQYLDEYIEAAKIAPAAPLFQGWRRRIGLTGIPIWPQDAHAMVRRRAEAAGIKTKIGNHTFRATGITAYMKNGGRLEIAQQIANHSSPRTTKLYDRSSDEVSLGEVEKIAI